jgi:hypothetical protein
VGLALRNATCLGLHLRAADNLLTRTQLEERARVWYTVYSLEVAMSEVLGKPPSISLAYTTVPIELLKRDSNEDPPSYIDTPSTSTLWLDFLRRRRSITQSMRGGQIPWQNFQFIGHGAPEQHLFYRTSLALISNQVMAQLYMPNQSDSWAATQKKITGLHVQLLDWEKSLPEELNLQSAMAVNTDPRAKIDLALYYHSIKMILSRPCLCHIRIPRESMSSKEFNISNAKNCVYAALSLVGILPDDPTPHETYQLLPWWSLLHYLGQALGVFVLELCLNTEHFGGSVGELTPHIRKAMSYLWCLATGSLSAYKAWRIFRQMLLVLSFRFDNLDIADIPVNASVPAGWTEMAEALLMETLGAIGEPGIPRN